MPIPPVALKRRNHRLLLCLRTRKNALLSKLLEENAGKRVAVVAAAGTELTVPETVTLLSDDALPAETFELLISYDLPADPAHYFARLALTDDTVLTLFCEEEQKNLLAIETLLGRAISQERPDGFAPEPPVQPKSKPKHAPAKAERTAREKRPEKTPFKKEGVPAAKRKPKASGVSRFIGLDENGKPMFSGKTGERNHRYDGKPHNDESLAEKKEREARRKKAGGAKKAFAAKKKPAFKGEKKPYDAKKSAKASAAPTREKRPETAKPKRPVRRIKADKFKPTEPKE